MKPCQIIPRSDPPVEIFCCLLASPIFLPVRSRHLQRVEEAFHRRVIASVALPAQPAYHPADPQTLLISQTTILNPAIRMMNNIFVRIIHRHSTVKGLDGDLGFQYVPQRPTNHLARTQINHSSQKKQALPRRDLGDVRHPDRVRFVQLEVLIHDTGRRFMATINLGQPLRTLVVSAAQALASASNRPRVHGCKLCLDHAVPYKPRGLP